MCICQKNHYEKYCPAVDEEYGNIHAVGNKSSKYFTSFYLEFRFSFGENL
jgi:hypothetical protein